MASQPVAKTPRPVTPVDTPEVTPDADSGDDTSSESSKEPEPPVEPGSQSGIKQLYREDERFAWEDWAPDDVDIDVEDTPEAKKWALVVRKEKGKSGLVLHSITVQSKLLKGVLGPVFEGYSGISTKLKNLTFTTPFREFFYRWDNFQDMIKEDHEETTVKHIKLLEEIINAEIKPHIEKRDEYIKHGLVTFDYLWALFEPDIDVWSEVDGQDRIFKLNACSYQEIQGVLTCILSCRCIDTNGTTFGYSKTVLRIDAFDGVKPVSSLNVLPAHLHPEVKSIRTKLEQRGTTFRDLLGSHYRSYSGFYLYKDYFGRTMKRNLDNGRIIVDAHMYSTYNQENMPSLEPLDSPARFSRVQLDESDEDDDDEYASTQLQIMKAIASRVRRYEKSRKASKTLKPNMLEDEDLVYCTTTVRGYDLLSKQWVEFYVENVNPIKWNVESFQRLVLPNDYKELVLAFVEGQLSQKDKFDDIVQGKGQGIIMLLNGEPGVGKTLTAESVAEEMKRPLYSMGAGELGHTADEVERSLQRVLEISAKWGAVLLLDECDVFLEQRTASDIERNKLVSVFLRLLEYFKGVLLLTTNRIGTFDAAFQSRIHLTLNYPGLDFPSRLLVWKNFVRNEKEGVYVSDMSDADLEKMAEIELNGREIKNIIKTARLLATRKGTPLSMEHVQTVWRVKQGEFRFGKPLVAPNSDGACGHCGK
ncbi:hypothetical protein BP6252_07568 [Coleophoma cylindrospora]|uniref:AAA+ ATPase domain-containing protein n=1 Tax=Coleophoma cylindrospora TaxID=1849047 RepID=A0A3D8RAF7_9HELO|nr:hypothetical protein BP6252_07568 [Coleophoma cylindrospora]